MYFAPTPKFPGLTLKAWALVKWDGAALSLVRGSKMASVVRVSTGVYTFTFSAAMPSVDYIADASGVASDGVGFSGQPLVGSATLLFAWLGAVADPERVWVGFYA